MGDLCPGGHGWRNLAYQLSRIVVEKGEELGRASLHYPLDLVEVAQTSTPHHPGTARYYKEKGLQ